MLVFFLLLLPLESGASAISGSYTVYMSSNALFTLMALFVWFKPDEYSNYTTLYMAGKVVALISFYLWEIFTMRSVKLDENFANSIVLLCGGALIGLADMLSVWGAWTINKKYRRAAALESGGS
jgi:hypothetical protein